MKRYIAIFLMLAAVSFVGGCSKDATSDIVEEGGEVSMTVAFGAQSIGALQVGTRATLDALSENKVYNLYVFLFDSDGKKFYGHYFDSSLLTTDSNVANRWSVTNSATESAQTTGTVTLRTLSKTNATLYVMTNIDADMVNISPEKLALVQTENDMLNMVATLNQNIISRNGYFPMTGRLTGISTANGGLLSDQKLVLQRMDAKIKFNILIGTSTDPDKQVESFEPYKWRVVNVPMSAYVMNKTSRASQVDADGEYFATPFVNFEAATETSHSFSFYMLENSLAPLKTLSAYADRERQTKTPDGSGNLTNGDFEYANPNSTYVVITGKVTMKVTNAFSSGSTLNADVQYVVHLGDFTGNGVNDFNTLRNTFYTYNVTIMGVDDIRTEVETSTTENAPGATGDVVVAKEEIYVCDAHYSSEVLSFHAGNIEADAVTWYVKTPFCDGSPIVINGVDVPTGLDYQWVHFLINQRDQNGNYYEQRRRKYDPSDKNMMDVIELVKYLKAQKRAYDSGAASDFDNDTTAEGLPNPKISVTAFVDEYYYDVNPITGKAETNLWTKFVNHENRSMHILSDTQRSADGESIITGSSLTIKQRSIQSVYNIADEGVTTAWGAEYTDEYPDIWTYNSQGTGV